MNWHLGNAVVRFRTICRCHCGWRWRSISSIITTASASAAGSSMFGLAWASRRVRSSTIARVPLSPSDNCRTSSVVSPWSIRSLSLSPSSTRRFLYSGRNRLTASSNATRTRPDAGFSSLSACCTRIHAANSPSRSSRLENASAYAAGTPPAATLFAGARSEGTARRVENRSASGLPLGSLPVAGFGRSPTYSVRSRRFMHLLTRHTSFLFLRRTRRARFVNEISVSAWSILKPHSTVRESAPMRMSSTVKDSTGVRSRFASFDDCREANCQCIENARLAYAIHAHYEIHAGPKSEFHRLDGAQVREFEPRDFHSPYPHRISTRYRCCYKSCPAFLEQDDSALRGRPKAGQSSRSLRNVRNNCLLLAEWWQWKERFKKTFGIEPQARRPYSL